MARSNDVAAGSGNSNKRKKRMVRCLEPFNSLGETEKGREPKPKRTRGNTGDCWSLLLSLPEQVQHDVLSYCDVPALDTLVMVSKKTGDIAKAESLWEPFLKKLLREDYDDAITPNLHPLTERSDWKESTAMKKWWKARAKGTAVKIPSGKTMHCHYPLEDYWEGDENHWIPVSYPFLFENVPLREYYHGARKMSRDSVDKYYDSCESTTRCPECYEKMFINCTCYGDNDSEDSQFYGDNDSEDSQREDGDDDDDEGDY